MIKEQKILLLLILLIGGAGAGFYVSNAKKSKTETAAVTTPLPAATSVEANPTTTPPVQVSSALATTYSEDVTYLTPEEGRETIHVKLSVKEGVITDVSFNYDAPHKRESAYNLGNFEKALSSQGLIGKKVSKVLLSRVGGASLTTGAFNQALSQIAAKV